VKYFRCKHDEILNNGVITTDLAGFRNTEICTQDYRWLDDNEVSLGIAAVTLAVTRNRDIHHGFGFMDQANVQNCEDIDSVPVPETIRPGPPMLLPLHIGEH
jgi:hypothetical protein